MRGRVDWGEGGTLRTLFYDMRPHPSGIFSDALNYFNLCTLRVGVVIEMAPIDA